MSILWWIIIGGIAGAIAKLIMPGKDPGGIIVTILLGIAGAVVGGWILGLLLPGATWARLDSLVRFWAPSSCYGSTG